MRKQYESGEEECSVDERGLELQIGRYRESIVAHSSVKSERDPPTCTCFRSPVLESNSGETPLALFERDGGVTKDTTYLAVPFDFFSFFSLLPLAPKRGIFIRSPIGHLPMWDVYCRSPRKFFAPFVHSERAGVQYLLFYLNAGTSWDLSARLFLSATLVSPRPASLFFFKKFLGHSCGD